MSLFPGTQTGRPNSSSKRRKKPASKTSDKLKLSTKFSSDDYDSSLSEGIYSDEDSLENMLNDDNSEGQAIKDYTNEADDEFVDGGVTNQDNMHSVQRRKLPHSQQGTVAKARHDIAEVVEEADGKRTIGIQTFGRRSVRENQSDIDGSFSGSEIPNMVTSPVSLWQSNDGSDNESSGGRTSSASGGVVKMNISEREKTLNRSITNPARPGASFLSDQSNLHRGPTEMWSTSLSDLQLSPRFRDDLSFVMETEGIYPGEASADYLDVQSESMSSVYMRSPREGVRLIPRPDISTPQDSERGVSISFPESQLQQSSNLAHDTPVKYEVTVHEDNTNIVYNVQKTEYRTITNRNQNIGEPTVIPESICINMTETFVARTEEKSEKKCEETVKLGNPNEKGDGDLVLEKSYKASHSSNRETRTSNGDVITDNVTERNERSESHSSYFVPSENKGQPPQTLAVTTKVLKLEASGVVSATSYPGVDVGSPGTPPATNDELGASLDDSDYTSDYGTITSVDGRKGFISFTSDSEDNETKTDPDLSPGTSPRISHLSNIPDEKYPENLPEQSSTNYTDISSPFESLVEGSPFSDIIQKGESSEAISEGINRSADDVDGIETDTSSISTIKQLNPSRNDAVLSQDTLDDTESIDNQKDHESPVPRLELCHSPNRLLKKDDMWTDSSTDDVYLSVEQSETNTSSSSSDYRTPQQSPRNRFSGSNEMIDEAQLEDVVIPDFCESDLLQSTPRQNADETIIPDERPALTSSPKRVNDVRTVSVNTEAVSSVNNAPLTTSKVSHMFAGNRGQPDVCRLNLEKKIATLQHHVRSLSDSAISSDYTDGDSVSLSPRGSRVYEFDKRSGERRSLQIDNATRVYRLGHVRQPQDVDWSASNKRPFNDSGNVFDGDTDIEHENQSNQLSSQGLAKKTIKLNRPCPKGSMHRKTPESLVDALLSLKPYPLYRSISLDGLSTLVSMKPELLQSACDVQSSEDLRNCHDSSSTDNQQHRSLFASDIMNNLMSLPNGQLNRKVGEKSNSLDMLDDKPVRDYLRSLSENDIEEFTEGHDTSNTSNDSIMFVFIGDSSGGQRQRHDSDDYTGTSVNSIYTEELSNETFRSLSPGEIVDRPEDLDSSDPVYININDNDDSYDPSEEINQILNTDYNEELASSDDTLSESFDGLVQIRRPRAETFEDSKPLRHKFGIDESVLPIPERSVSADNLPKQLRVLDDNIRRSRSTGMINVGVDDEQDESESGIFPPRIHECADEDPTDKSISFRTTGGTDQSCTNTGSGFDDSDVYESDTTNSDAGDGNNPSNVKPLGSKASSTEDFREEFVIEYHANKDRFKYSATPSPAAPDFDPQGFHEQEHLRQVLETVQKFIMPKPITHDRGISTDDDDESSRFVSIGIQTDNGPTDTAQSGIQSNHIILPALAAPFRSQSMESFGLGTHGNTLELSDGERNWCTLGELMVETTELLRRINGRLPDCESLSASEENQASRILQQWQQISNQTGQPLTNLTTVGLQTEYNKMESAAEIMSKQHIETTKAPQVEPLKQRKATTSEVSPMACEDMSMQTDGDSSITSEESFRELVKEAPVLSKAKNIVTFAMVPNETKPKLKPDAKHSKSTESDLNQRPVESPKSDPKNPQPSDNNAGSYLDHLPEIMAKLGLGQPLPDSLNRNSSSPLDAAKGTTQQPAKENKSNPALTGKYLPQVLNELGLKDSTNNDENNPNSLNNDENNPNSMNNDENNPNSTNNDENNPNSTNDYENNPNSMNNGEHNQNSTNKDANNQNSTNNDENNQKNSTRTQAERLPGFTLPDMPEIDELRKEHAKLMNNIKKASEERKARKDAIKARKKIPFTRELTDEEHLDSSKRLIRGPNKNDPESTEESGSEVDTVLSDDNDEQGNASGNDVIRSDDNEEEQISDMEPVQSDENDEVRTSVSSATSVPDVVQISIQVDPKTGLIVENKTYQDGSPIKEKTKKPTLSKEKKIPKPTHEHTWEMTKDELTSVWEKLPEGRGKLRWATPEEDLVESEERSHVKTKDDKNDENEVIDDVLGNDILHKSTSPLHAERSPKHKAAVPNSKCNKTPATFTDDDEPVQEEEITPQTFKRDQSVPLSKLKSYDNVDAVFEDDPRERGPKQSPTYIKSETSPKFKPQRNRDAMNSISPELFEPVDHTNGPDNRNNYPRNIAGKPVSPNKVSKAEPEAIPLPRRPPMFADDSTQMSVAYSDTETQTDLEIPSEVNEARIVPEKKTSAEAGKSEEAPGSNNDAPKTDDKDHAMKDELEKLQKEKQHILDLLGLSGVPNSVTVELLEAKLNYCIGQTDLLLDNLDTLVPDENVKKPKTEDQKTKDFITKYREDLKQSKADVEECRKQLSSPSGRGRGAGRGRTHLRRQDFFNHQRQAEVEAFRLERLREQQDYEKSRHGISNKGSTPLKGNTPLLGNSPVVTPRSDISRDSSPSYSPCYITPREHKAHLIDLRRQLINDVVEEELQYSRSCSPRLGHGNHLSPSKNRSPPRFTSPSDQSQGFSPKVSGSFPDSRRSSSSDSPLGYNAYGSPSSPNKLSPDSRRPATGSPNRSFPNSPERGATAKRMSPDARLLPESVPIEEILRRSSFSSTNSQR